MIRQPYVRHLDDAPRDTRPGRTDGVRCELLIDADRTLSHGFSPGVLEFPTGTAWTPQHLDPQKVYLIRESDGKYSINPQKSAPIRSSTTLKIAFPAFKTSATGP